MMVTQNRQPQAGVNPGNKGPAQPQDVEDPHPDNEEGYREDRGSDGSAKDGDIKSNRRPSDTSTERRG